LLSPGFLLCGSCEGPAPSNEPKEFDGVNLTGVDDWLLFGGV
jgi:hypothetical protein